MLSRPGSTPDIGRGDRDPSVVGRQPLGPLLDDLLDALVHVATVPAQIRPLLGRLTQSAKPHCESGKAEERFCLPAARREPEEICNLAVRRVVRNNSTEIEQNKSKLKRPPRGFVSVEYPAIPLLVVDSLNRFLLSLRQGNLP